jgi:hypothetical protein
MRKKRILISFATIKKILKIKNVYFLNKVLSLAALAARYIIPKPSSLGSTMLHLMLYPPTITLGAKKKLRKKGKGHTQKEKDLSNSADTISSMGPWLYSDTYTQKAFESHFSFLKIS